MAKGKKVLLLGGGGFIGEALGAALRAKGHSVSVPARAELELPRDAAFLRTLIPVHDTVVYLLPPSVQGMYEFVRSLATVKNKQVIYTSTALLYASSHTPQNEEAPLKAQSAYEQLKLAEELLLRYARDGHTLTIARLGNVYGGIKNKGIIGKALKAMHGGPALEISGESQLRDFIHVDDVARALAHIVGSTVPGVINVTTAVGTSIAECLTLMERISGQNIPWVRSKEREEKDMVGDNAKLIASGFVPSIVLEEGLKKTLQLYARPISQ